MSELYTQSLVDEVLARTDLRAVVEQYVALKRKGGRFFGRCPFHEEKTPSFSVSPDQGLFYCFGCQAGGSAVQFLMRVESWSFPEALEELARRAGVTLPERGHGQPDDGERARRKHFYELMERATVSFERNLTEPAAKQARAYLVDRGISDETSQSFRLGYALPGWEDLLRTLARGGTSQQEVADAGLAIPSKRGGYYDRFRDRIVFPVSDRRGHIVGFSARAMKADEQAKYINSPEVKYFKKGEHLYGLLAAKEALRKSRQAVLVEGNFDVVTLSQAGFPQTLAPLGTALTESQVRLLRRLADDVVIIFDGDEAGRRALKKCLGPCYHAELGVRATLLPEGSDPDSFVRERGADALRDLIERARPLAEVILDDVVLAAVGGAPEERLRAGQRAAKTLQQLPEGALRRRYLEDAARRLGLTARELVPARKPARHERGAPEQPRQRPARPTRLPDRERLLVQLLVDQPHLAERLSEDALVLEALRAPLRSLVERLRDASTFDAPHRLERLVDELEDGLRPGVLEAVAADREYGEDGESVFEELIWRLQRDYLEREVQRTRELLRAAERAGDQAKARELSQRSVRLARAKRGFQLGQGPPRA